MTCCPIKRWLLGLGPLVAFGFISWLAYTGQATPFFHAVSSFPGGDKIGHFSLMFLASVSISAAFSFRGLRVGAWRVYTGALLVVFFISIDEWCQRFSFYRSVDVFDEACNVAGIAAAIVAVNIYQKRHPRPKPEDTNG